MRKLQVVYLYIPTSNHNCLHGCCDVLGLYIFIFLHQTTTRHEQDSRRTGLYIFIFLHQTTTTRHDFTKEDVLYIFIFLHQTTTYLLRKINKYLLYIFIFLHQTTTVGRGVKNFICCISLYSYIKPQRWESWCC